MTNHPPIHATIAGTPRIGPNRELKRALESYWKGDIELSSLENVSDELAQSYARDALAAGLDSIPYAGRSWYDAILDTSALLGLLPRRVQDLPSAPDRYFAAARGTTTLPASPMTKWFDTNYHYIVPELDEASVVTLDDATFISNLKNQLRQVGNSQRPVLIGPLTYLSLARSSDDSDPLRLLDQVFAAYVQLLAHLEELHLPWIQFDEPALVLDTEEALLTQVRAGYSQLAQATTSNLLVQTYFGDGNQAIRTLSGTGVAVFGVDAVAGSAEFPDWTGTELLLVGIVDGRNIWRTDLDNALETLQSLQQRGPIGVSTSCSLLHVPYSLEPEKHLDPTVRNWLAFGAEKIQEVAALHRFLENEATAADEKLFQESREVAAERANSPLTHNQTVRSQAENITAADRSREAFALRQQAQKEALSLPSLPTTTIGSFPQTAEIRRARAQFRAGALNQEQYEEAMRAEIATVIKEQEQLGLDVLVHGEPERNDMVQYFAEHLQGFLSTDYGWVQSYGSRCVRPPILFGDVYRPETITVPWYKAAAQLTKKPVKRMLTGPVTILAWSFIRDDQPLADTADQVALALRAEIQDLVAAGTQIIQVDEPAIRELLPLHASQQEQYLQWAVGSFRLATAGAPKEVQIHTHMCYSEFNELIDTITALDADVTSIEAARGGMQVLSALRTAGYKLGIGPGVWDIHSPRVPQQDEVDALLTEALASVDPQLLWVNPDCGLKTRGWEETRASLQVLVHAAQEARAKL